MWLLQAVQINKKTIVKDWMHSGDLGYLDKDIFLFLVDRVKDSIISGSVNIFPKYIEKAIIQHSALAKVFVSGIPDKKGVQHRLQQSFLNLLKTSGKIT